MSHKFIVKLESTNETKEIILTAVKLLVGDPRQTLMKEISAAFNLTKPFQIEEL